MRVFPSMVVLRVLGLATLAILGAVFWGNEGNQVLRAAGALACLLAFAAMFAQTLLASSHPVRD